MWRPKYCHSTGLPTVVWVSAPRTYPNEPSIGLSSWAMPAGSGLAVYGSGIALAAGAAAGWPPARDCPVAEVNVYTNPGCSMTVNRPPCGVMSPRSTNWPGPRRLVLHTWTTRPGRPPVTRMVSGRAALATDVSATRLQAERSGAS